MTSRLKIGREEMIEILKVAASRDEPAVLTPKGLAASFFCPILSVSEEEVIVLSPIPPEMAEKVVSSPGFVLFCRSYKIEADKLSPKGKGLVFSIPREAELSQGRNDERVYAEGSNDNYILIKHPYDKGTEIKRQLIDTSKGGFSFRARKITSLIQTGRVLNGVRIFIDGSLVSTRNGKIVYVTRIIDSLGSSSFQVGVKFTESISEARK
jgi:hypothetical protein